MQQARLRTVLLSVVAGGCAVAFARLGISSLPVAWFVLAVNAAFILRFAAARARAPQATQQKPIELTPNLAALIQSAGAEAGRRGHRNITLEHLLLVMSRDAEIATLLRACNADPDELARELEDYLGLLSPEKLDVSQVQRALEGAALVAMRAGRTQMSTQSVLVQIRRDPDAYASLLLRAAGIELVDLLRCISHGKPDVRPHALTGVTRAALRMHNDDFTTMEFVVHVLHSFFGMNEVEAKQRMLQIHSEGSVVVATLPMEDALGRAVRIFDEAERAEFPLRCSLEAA
jgi:ATP-dependent Clp protease adapter protein ClpS